MAKELRGDLQGSGLRVAIVVSRFNQFITQKLLDGALEGLRQLGVQDSDATVAWVPGSFEIPLAAKTLAQSGSYEAVICLGAVIRGETMHFEMVANESARGIGRASLDTGVPVIFGVVTADNIDQAINRAGGKSGNIGFNAALAAVDMARLLATIKGKGKS